MWDYAGCVVVYIYTQQKRFLAVSFTKLWAKFNVVGQVDTGHGHFSLSLLFSRKIKCASMSYVV